MIWLWLARITQGLVISLVLGLIVGIVAAVVLACIVKIPAW